MPAPLALLFPGQGAQFVGMGQELADTFPCAHACFEEADELLHFPLSKLIWKGPVEELTRTQICQPALYVTSMAALVALNSEFKIRDLKFNPASGAGLSLGEYTALAAAGAVSFQEGLKLVQLRAEAMEEAARMSQGTMASVLGLELEPLEAICASTGAQVANINAPGQIVISGPVEKVQAAAQKAKELGAKRVVMLEVGGAFHSRLMEPAASRLREALETVAVQPPRYPVLSNVTASAHTTPAGIRQLLFEQLTRPVRWESCMRNLASMGITHFLEVGPGTILKGLLKRIDPEALVRSAGTVQEIREVAAAFRA